MDRSTSGLSRSTARVPVAVSTRSMARIASASSSTSASSNLTRPTLSSIRKVNTTVQRSSTTALGISQGRKKLIVRSDTSPHDASESFGSAGGAGTLGGKRKALDEGGPGKKLRLYSPETRRLPSTGSAAAARRPIKAINTARVIIPSTPVRTAFPPASRFEQHWVHRHAPTPNRILPDSPPREGDSMSDDEMLLCDDPPVDEFIGHRPLAPTARSFDGGWKVPPKRADSSAEDVEMDGTEDKENQPSRPAARMEMAEVDDSMGSVDSPTRSLAPSSHTVQVLAATPPGPAFTVSTTPSKPPPSAFPARIPAVSSGCLATSRAPSHLLPNAQASSSLAPPTPAYTIAASPRKGLATISRFGTAKKPGATTSSSTGSASKTMTQSSISQYFSRPGISSAKSSPVPSPAALQPANRTTSPASAGSMDVDPHPTAQPSPRLSQPSATPATSTMLPPSRIPVRASKPPTVYAPSLSASTAGSSKKAALGSLGVAAQHPLVRSTTFSAPGSNRPSPADEPIRRKPSYPSSLGSGPLTRPRDRQISVPVPSHVIEPILRDVPVSLPSNHAREPLRSVSAPVPRENQQPTERQALSLSTRREGWMDTNRSLHGLSEALERLKVKKDVPAVEPTRRPSLAASTARTSLAGVPDGQKENLLGKSVMGPPTGTSRLSAVHKSRYSIAGGSVAGVIMNPTEGESTAGEKAEKPAVVAASGAGCFKGVVAYVDVWTADGTDSSGIFADMLRSLGARVLSRPSDSCTHVIYKSGRPATLNWYRKQKQMEEEDPECRRPHIVGLSWVTRSKEAGKRLDEAKYAVDTGEEDVFAKRRKSMEPKSLSLAALSSSVGPGQGHRPSIPSGIAEAKRRSLVYAPKVGSPLKKALRREESFEQAV